MNTDHDGFLDPHKVTAPMDCRPSCAGDNPDLVLISKQPSAGVTKTSVLKHHRETVSIPNLFQKVSTLLESGELIKAECFLTITLSRDLSTAEQETAWEQWMSLGSAYYLELRYREARNAYQYGCDLFPTRLISQFNLGTAHLMLGDFSGALKCFKRAKEIQPFEAKVLCNLGAAYFMREDYRSAVDALKNAVLMKPNYIRALNNLSSALRYLESFEECFQICDRVLELSPNHPEACFNKALIYLHRKEYQAAVDHFQIAIDEEKLHFDSQCYLAQILAARSNPQQAEEILVLDREINGRQRELLAHSWKAVSDAWLKLEDFERAAAALQASCERFPYNAQSWVELGLLQKRLGQEVEAARSFQIYGKLQAWQPGKSKTAA